MKRSLKQLPLLPSQRTIHLMAKAAVAVDEGAVEEGDGRMNFPSRSVFQIAGNI